jgi:hypothetical protein
MTTCGGVLQDLWNYLEQQVFPFQPAGCIFNQYSQIGEHDLPDGDRVRRENLRRYIEHFRARPTVVLVGEAAGYRGCRFSAIPFTSEAHLLMGVPVKGNPSSRNSAPWVEASAKVFWQNLKPFSQQFFVWNTLPFHLYREGNLLSNRTPTRKEFGAHQHLLAGILNMLRPETIGAIGKQAEALLREMGYPCTYIRHPSYGGKK